MGKRGRPARERPKCETCGNPTRLLSQKFCSRQCHAKYQIKENSRQCLCCGKTWHVRRGGARRQTVFTNAFCSKVCSGKYSRWETDRKARCRCGKATGKRNATCIGCLCIPRIELLLAWDIRVKQCFGPRQGPWDRRIRAADKSLRLRMHPRIRHPSVVPSTWDDAILNERKRLRKHEEWSDWKKRIKSAENLLGKRVRRQLDRN